MVNRPRKLKLRATLKWLCTTRTWGEIANRLRTIGTCAVYKEYWIRCFPTCELVDSSMAVVGAVISPVEGAPHLKKKKSGRSPHFEYRKMAAAAEMGDVRPSLCPLSDRWYGSLVALTSRGPTKHWRWWWQHRHTHSCWLPSSRLSLSPRQHFTPLLPLYSASMFLGLSCHLWHEYVLSKVRSHISHNLSGSC